MKKGLHAVIYIYQNYLLQNPNKSEKKSHQQHGSFITNGQEKNGRDK